MSITIPPGAKAIIVAELHENKSDSGNDLWSSEVVETIYLAWSYTERDNFNEMRKAAAIAPYPEITAFSKKRIDPKRLKPADEHREKYSMGKGYYLAIHSHEGWQIRKQLLKLFDQTDTNRMIYAMFKKSF